MLKKISLSFFIFLTALASFSQAEDLFFIENEGADQEPVRAELIVEEDSVQANRPFCVGIRFKMDEHWHAYWKNPGDAGMAPVIQWNLPKGFLAGPIRWPTPHKFSLNSAVSFGYQDEMVLLAEVTPPAKIENSVTLKADIKWVACDNSSCLPGNAEVSITLPKSSATPKPLAQNQSLFQEARAKLPRSNANAAAERKDALLTLKLETTENAAGVRFFPENGDRIDYTVDAVLIKSAEHPNTYNVILKEAEAADPSAPLKGVVALLSGENEGNILEAYDIDVPVFDKGLDTVAIRLPEDSAASSASSMQKPHELQGNFGLALVFAFLGGLILNLMPCVLPVISFKILSFVKMAGKSRSLTFKHGAAFSGGVLLSFWTLAGILLALQAYGRAVGWGFQLQEPLFVAILAAIIFVFGLSLFGVFEMGAGFASLAGQTQTSASSEGLAASFFSGILATAIATPCTGPFLGTAVGFAVTLPAPLAMLIFTTLGLGMAFPYLLLGAFPNLLRFMPKPGNWMVTFKEIMGFVMLATVLWLIWVFGAQTSAFSVVLLLAGFFFLGVGSWIFGKWGTPIKKKKIRQISYACALLCFLMGGYILFQAATDNNTGQNLIAEETSDWEPFSPERINKLREKGIPVFVDFTAKWCLICQANHMVLSVDEISAKFKELGVVKMKADLTKNNPAIVEELRKFGRNSVPLYLLYSVEPDTPPAILPQVLTPDIIVERLEQMQKEAKSVSIR